MPKVNTPEVTDKSITKGKLSGEVQNSLNSIGTLSALRTNSKDTLVNSINELFQYASNGKTLVANAITGKGVQSNSNMTFQQLATNISNIKTGYSREEIESGKVIVGFKQSKVFSNTGFYSSEFMNFKYPYINFKSGSFNIENGAKDNLFHYNSFSKKIDTNNLINAYVYNNILYICRIKSSKYDYMYIINRTNIITGESFDTLEINLKEAGFLNDKELRCLKNFYYIENNKYLALIDNRDRGYAGGFYGSGYSSSIFDEFFSKIDFDPGAVRLNNKSFIGTKINNTISCISNRVADWDWVDGYGGQKSLFFIVNNNDINLSIGSFDNNNDYCISYNNNIYIIKNSNIIKYSPTLL